ncbi:MAG: hypothetical protein HC923_08420, partial [Myxococcales bacterium]|nr:hypothetical protein [Myxococcales bacterium]
MNRYRPRFAYRIHEDHNQELGAVVYGRIIPFVEVARVVLDQVRRQAAAALRTDIR